MEKGFNEDSAQVLMNLSGSMRDLVRHVASGVVQVDAEHAQARSGLRYDEHHVLTSAVYAAAGETVRVRVLTSTPGAGGQKTFKDFTATVVGQDPATGLVLVGTSDPIPAAELEHRTDPVSVGELVASVALPSYDGVEARLGLVRCAGGPFSGNTGRDISGYIQTDSAPFPGFAGAPLVDMAGKVVGVHTVSADGLIIPVESAFEIAKQIAEHRLPISAYLGVRSQEADITAAQQSKIGRQQAIGLLVVSVETGSPAETSGIVTGDILLALGNRELRSHEDLIRELDQTGIEKPVAIEILRGGELQKIEARLVAATDGPGEHRGHHAWHNAGHRAMREGFRRMSRWHTRGTAG